jgi:hypothetical protein
MIEASLRQIGAARSGVIDENGVILAGNGTFDALTAAGINKVKIVEADGQEWVVVRRKGLTAEQKRALAIADNRAAELAEWDGPMLAAQGIDLAPWFTNKELTKIGADDGSTVVQEGPDPQWEKAEALRKHYGVDLGQVWQLGDHRLMCGDTGLFDNWRELMAGIKAQLCVTSPPYAVGKEYEKETTFRDHLALLRAFADRAIENIIAGGFIFINFGEIAPLSHAGPLTGSARQCIYPISKDYWQIFHIERSCDLYGQRIWYKPFNRLQQPFWSYHTSIPHHQEWEHIWTWRTPGGESDEVYDWDISVHAVWDTRNEATGDRPLTRHVAAFPVGIPERAIKAHSKVDDGIIEPFSGSGTTMIVCEQLKRKCYAMEISSAYVAVAIQRWVDLTGKEPKIIDDVTRGRTTEKTDQAPHPARKPRQAAAAGKRARA